MIIIRKDLILYLSIIVQLDKNLTDIVQIIYVYIVKIIDFILGIIYFSMQRKTYLVIKFN